MHKNLTVIATFTDSQDPKLLVIRSKLEAAGIKTFVENEALSSMIPIFTQALGGTKLSIPTQDLNKVKDLVDLKPTQPPIQCPNCGGENIKTHTPSPLIALLKILTLGLFSLLVPPNPTKNRTCQSCKHTWH